MIYRIIEHGSTEHSYGLVRLIKLCHLGPQFVMQLHGSSNNFHIMTWFAGISAPGQDSLNAPLHPVALF